MSAEEAYALAKEYLERLLEAEITIPSKNQLSVYNGLVYYARIQDMFFFAVQGDERKMAALDLNNYLPTVRQCQPIVDYWLSQGQPLGDFKMPIESPPLEFRYKDKF